MNGDVRIEIGTFGSAFQSYRVVSYQRRATIRTPVGDSCCKYIFALNFISCDKVLCLRRCLVALLDVPDTVSGGGFTASNTPCIHPSHPIREARCCRIQYESQASCQRCCVTIWIHLGLLECIKTKRS